MLQKHCPPLLSFLLLVLLSQGATAQEIWRVPSGRTTVYLNQNLLTALGLGAHGVPTEPLPLADPMMEEPNWTFGIQNDSDLLVRVNTGSTPPYAVVGGALRHGGSLVFKDEIGGRTYTLDGVMFEYLAPGAYTPTEAVDPNPFYLRDTDGTVLLEVVYSMLRLEGLDRLAVHYMNLRISNVWAAKMKRPELGGLVIGGAEVRAAMQHVSGAIDRTPLEPSPAGSFLDVKLGFLFGLQWVARLGSTNALSMATTSCNVGDVDVPWHAPMQENHPLIHMALYRLMDGKLEQIGISWMKHGFFALSNDDCTTCQNPSDGSFLGVGCSDTYGQVNNQDRRYLGPRSEVNPYLGTWECSGSHFQGAGANCVRNHTGTGHNAIEHRLVAEDADLDLSGAMYFYEAYYIVQGDMSRDNNWGSREVTMDPASGNSWDFTDVAPMQEGPALYRWGQQRVDFPIPADGKVILAVQTTNLGGGTYHYQYALLNYDSEREVRSFSLPVAGVSNVTGMSFHDSDDTSLNDWIPTLGGGVLTWNTETFAQNPAANALTFGEMFSFGFDADAVPDTLTATLGLFMPPAGESVNGSILGPQNDASAPSHPLLSSSTHTPSVWSKNPVVVAEWSGASDPDGIGGYSFVWDQLLGTLPDQTIDTIDEFTASPVLGEATNHRFHLRTVDSLGNWTTDAAHLGSFLIDTTPPLNPTTVNADRAPSTWSNKNKIVATWSGAVDPGTGSGVAGYSFVWDTSPLTVPDETADTTAATTAKVVADGNNHYFHVRTVDVAGNAANADSTVHRGPFWVDTTPPQDPQTVSTNPPFGWTNDNTVRVAWSDYSDAGSGVQAFSFLFNQTAVTLPDTTPDAAPGDSAVSNPLPQGNNWFHLRTRDVVGFWTSTIHVGAFAVDTTGPSCAVLTPVGGEQWTCNTSQNLTWNESDALSGVQSVEVRLSTDNGATFPTLIANPAPGTGSFAWDVPEPGGTQWKIRVEVVDAASNSAFDVSEAFEVVCPTLGAEERRQATQFVLERSVPNPFGVATRIPYAVPEAQHVVVAVWSPQGRLVRTLVEGDHAPGWYETTWNGEDNGGRRVSSGIYYYSMTTPKFRMTRKLVLIR